jgi:hypothetical protein
MTERNEAIDVRHNVAASRFEATVDGLLCRADYRLDDGVMRMHHTEIPAQLEGRGIAGRLVREAFRYVEANGLKVVPQCSYVAAYVRRHPEVQHLVT